MLRSKVSKLMETTAETERKKLLTKCNSNETVVMLPTKISFTEKGLLDRISVFNMRPYKVVNETLGREYCPFCGEIVKDDVFITDKSGQKTHIECYKK